MQAAALLPHDSSLVCRAAGKPVALRLAGGGVKRGVAYGETDEFGHHPVSDKVHMHDLHATLLHALGLDHEKLTCRYAGRISR